MPEGCAAQCCSIGSAGGKAEAEREYSPRIGPDPGRAIVRPVAARDRIAAQGPSRSGQPCGTDRRRSCMSIARPSRSARPECCGACGNAERAVADGSTGSGSCRSTGGSLVSALCRPGGGDSGALHAPLTGCPSTGQVWAWVRRRPRSVVSFPMTPAHQGRNEATQSAARIRAWNTGRHRNDAARASAVNGASPPPPTQMVRVVAGTLSVLCFGPPSARCRA